MFLNNVGVFHSQVARIEIEVGLLAYVSLTRKGSDESARGLLGSLHDSKTLENYHP